MCWGMVVGRESANPKGSSSSDGLDLKSGSHSESLFDPG